MGSGRNPWLAKMSKGKKRENSGSLLNCFILGRSTGILQIGWFVCLFGGLGDRGGGSITESIQTVIILQQLVVYSFLT